MTKILVIEDNIETQYLLKKILVPTYDVTMASDLKSAWECIESQDWDIVILDRSLPDGDGLELCLKLKKLNLEYKFSIVMLTAYGELDEKIKGLSAGADDYVVKPFEPRELLARLEAIQRRRMATSNNFHSTINLANLIINMETHAVSARTGKDQTTSIDLTPIEFKILLTLVKNYGKEISRESLVQVVWDKINLSERNIDTHVCHLRKKINLGQLAIKNRRNKGYYLTREEQPSTQTPAFMTAAATNTPSTLPYSERN
ncbi:MAG: response regulator transcription factor [Bdellovibrio sp.]|nr:response regulator transcription factor [Bdellovibrio sp.]